MTAPTALRLPRELTIYTVGETRHALMTWIAALGEGAGHWRLDAAGVEEADAAGVQLLLALSRSASAVGATLHLDAPSDALCRASAQLGVAPIVLGTLTHESHA
jgi:anti-anti-sigma regulatory factor